MQEDIKLYNKKYRQLLGYFNRAGLLTDDIRENYKYKHVAPYADQINKDIGETVVTPIDMLQEQIDLMRETNLQGRSYARGTGITAYGVWTIVQNNGTAHLVNGTPMVVCEVVDKVFGIQHGFMYLLLKEPDGSYTFGVGGAEPVGVYNDKDTYL